MNTYLSFITFVSIALSLTSCERANEVEPQNNISKGVKALPSVLLYNENVPFLINLMEQLAEDGIVGFNSFGGETSAALKIADFIQENSFAIQVNSECLSGCAEVILPSASKLEFVDRPFIGFHQSILSYQHNIEALAIRDTQFCKWSYADRSRDLLNQKKLNVDFWRETMERLKPNIKFIYQYRTCPMDVYNFENDWWLPTSKQLQNLWGLEFSGSVCADDYADCGSKIDQRWKKGTRVVIGDKIYTSKGK